MDTAARLPWACREAALGLPLVSYRCAAHSIAAREIAFALASAEVWGFFTFSYALLRLVTFS